jgi:putative transcriptional regulator
MKLTFVEMSWFSQRVKKRLGDESCRAFQNEVSMDRSESASFFERLRHGLQESIAHSRGQLTLKTIELPSPPPTITPRQVQLLRKKLQMSQAVFAATLNVSAKLVQSWEQGSRRPGRSEARLIQIIARQPQVISDLFASSTPGHLAAGR